MASDPYATLGVPEDASEQDIKRAFRRIARECHPDVAGPDPAAADRFKTARLAYETLIDPEARARHDRRQARRATGSGGGSFFEAFYRASGRDRPHHRQRGPATRPGAAGNQVGLDDLFADFGSPARDVPPAEEFGFEAGTSPRAGAREPGPGGAAAPVAGADVHLEVAVPARVAAEGGSVTTTYHRLRRADGWHPGAVDHGLVRQEDLAVIRIVPGTRSGEVVREKGLGDAGAFGGPHGDLVVRLRVEAGEATEAPGQDLLEVDVGVGTAVLGGIVEVATPRGRVRLRVPAGTSSGATFRLRARGAEGPSGPRDLLVQVRIVVPSAIDAESRRLIEEFVRRNPG